MPSCGAAATSARNLTCASRTHGRHGRLELLVVQLRVQAAAREEFRMRAALDDARVVHDEDLNHGDRF